MDNGKYAWEVGHRYFGMRMQVPNPDAVLQEELIKWFESRTRDIKKIEYVGLPNSDAKKIEVAVTGNAARMCVACRPVAGVDSFQMTPWSL